MVLKSDTVKDDSGNDTVFTEKGASASHMTAAQVLDLISRLPGCAGHASDAASACTHVKHERRTRSSSSVGRRLSKDLHQLTESKRTKSVELN